MYDIFGITDTGKKREHNEDHFLIHKAVICSGEIGVQIAHDFIAAVADGMGGENAGEVASRMALSALALARPDASQNDLVAIITGAHKALLDYGATHPEAAGLGTTIAGIACCADRVTVFHVGDSRVYAFINGTLRPRTTDHSLVRVLFESGEITREQMLTHPQKNIILQSLGGAPATDKFEVSIKQECGLFEPGDLFIICSDGLTDMVSDDDIEILLRANADMHSAVAALVARANENGGLDNITVVGIKKQEAVIQPEPHKAQELDHV